MANFFGIICDSLPDMIPKRKQKHTNSILFIPLLLKTLLTTPLILTFTVFSLLFLHHSWLHFSHLLTLSSQFLSNGTDKSYIFLLCNGLLVLVANYSYLTLKTNSVPFSSSEPFTSHYLDPSTDLSTQFGLGKTILPEYPHSSVASHISFWENDSPSDQNEPPPLHLKKEEVEKRSEAKREELDGEVGQFPMITDCNHYEHDEYKVPSEETEKGVYMEEDEEYAEESENAKMSREELNRKIEDFIRKRKEELRIEALKQLIYPCL